MTGVSRAVSQVLKTPAADPQDAQRHFLGKLGFETDPSDVHYDLEHGIKGFRVLDVRSPKAYGECHLPGAVNLPHAHINAEITAGFAKDELLVVYCWSPACNGAARAALRLSALGLRVKEMIGGIQYWQREGFATEGTRTELEAVG